MPRRMRSSALQTVDVGASVRDPIAAPDSIAVDVLGRAALAPGAPAAATIRRYARAAAAACGLRCGHLAVHLVEADRIAQLNGDHRGRRRPTDVLAFPIDGIEASRGWASEEPPPELGDVFICPQFASDLLEALVHGVLHLCGMDHERDGGEMLALQERVLSALSRRRSPR